MPATNDRAGRLSELITPRKETVAMASTANSTVPKKKKRGGEPTVMVVSKKDHSVHPCLVSAVPYALQNGYEVQDPQEYDRLRKWINGEADDGDIVRPATAVMETAQAAEIVSEAAQARQDEAAKQATWAEKQRMSKRREVVRPNGP